MGGCNVLGGRDNNYNLLNDVWSSTDGKNWVRETIVPDGRGEMVLNRYRIWAALCLGAGLMATA